MHSTTKKSIALIAIAVPMLAILFLCVAFLVGAKDTETQSWLYVAKTSELPGDGTPIMKTVSVTQFDAWTRLPDKPICQVFVRKSLSADAASVMYTWHHDGFKIPLRYDPITQRYVSICWNVTFDLQGKEVTGKGSIPSDLSVTQLPAKVIDDVVWVRLDGVRY